LAVMTIAKPVYLVFGMLVYSLRSKWPGLKGFVFRSLVIILPALVYLIWLLVRKQATGTIYVDSIAVAHADPSTQAGYLVPNVFNFFEPFMNTIFLGWGDNVFISVIGMFGKLDTPLPLLFVALGYSIVLMAVLVGTDRERDKLPKMLSAGKIPLNLVILGCSFAYIAGVYLSMYIFSTPPHEKIVTGVQGRYLLPLIPMLVLFTNKSLIIMRTKVYEKLMITLPVILLISSIVVIYLRYYVYYP
jgi:uncharacterized membrane protein